MRVRVRVRVRRLLHEDGVEGAQLAHTRALFRVRVGVRVRVRVCL